MPLVSVIIETYNADSDAEIDLDHVLGRLRTQTYSQDRIEVLVVVEEANSRLIEDLEERFPWVRVVLTDDPSYYAMKVRGLDAATGEILALTDADCALPVDYVERLARDFEAGADVVVGKVRFTRGARWAKTFDLFCFAHIKADAEGRAQAFSVNNVAFKREIARAHPFDPRIRRSGGAYLLCRQLRAAGCNVVYDPEIAVYHDAYDLYFQMMMRIRTGYEVVNLARIDEKEILPETRLRRLGVLAPVVSSARRCLIDLRNVLSDRRELDISIPEVPYFFLASLVVRTIEAGAGVLTVLRPSYLADRYGW